MKSLVICPSERGVVAALSESAPLASFPLYGKTLLAHWLEHMAGKGARSVRVLVAGPVSQIDAEVDGGYRWGLDVQVISELEELSAESAWLKYCADEINEIVIAHHLPGTADRDVFTSYAQFFSALIAWMPMAVASARAGLRQIKPGVWAGLRTRIPRNTILRAPVWLGEDVQIQKHVVLGPDVVVEDCSVIESSAEVAESFIGPETCVGPATRVYRSFALGNTLINWKKNSVTKICDPLLLGVLGRAPVERRIAELSALAEEAAPMPLVDREPTLSEPVKFGKAG